jgi:glycerol-3-phosphate dehydrogenase (NAD(P)+)
LLLTLASAELSKILKAANAHPNTAYGLACLGDLVTTGFSPHGRNRTYGERLVGATSKNPTDLGLTTVEGLHATELATKLARRLNVQTPLLDSVASCLTAETCFTQPFEAFLRNAKF